MLQSHKKILSFQYLMLLGRRKLPPTPIGRFPKTIQPCKIVNCSCLIDTKLYVKCSKSVTLMSNWLKFGEIVPFGGRSPSQPTTCPVSQCPTQVTVADICFTHIHEQFELRADAHFFFKNCFVNSLSVPYSSQSCRHSLHIFTNGLINALTRACYFLSLLC